MAALQTQTESQAVELAAEAFIAFCEDISGMFGVEIACCQKEVRSETVEGLKKCYRRLAAVNVVRAEGALNGTFQLIFDQEGLFTLGGVIVMLPERTILANRKDASAQLAASMVDAVSEAGNLLVGAWDRIFRQGLKGHGHFSQRLPAFVGKPWDQPAEKIALRADEDVLYVAYEMTIGSYPAFSCGVIFPKSIFAGRSDAAPAEGAPAQGDSQNPEMAPQEQDIAAKADSKPIDAGTIPAPATTAKEETVEPPPADAPTDQSEPSQADMAEKRDGGKSKSKRRAAGKTSQKKTTAKAAALETETDEPSEAETTEAQTAPPSATTSEKSDDPTAGEISQTIRRMTQSAAVLPGEPGQPAPAGVELTDFAEQPVGAAQTPTSLPGQSAAAESATHLLRPLVESKGGDGRLSMPARQVMKNRVVWATPEETVQQALSKMQQHDVGYLMIGQDGALEGIVSRSDITGALSPYLRSIFAKWRRPLDDATLRIKIKWIMSRPVRTVTPEAPLAAVMENVCRFGGRAVPVVDEQGKVQGLVTVFDVFQALLKTCEDVATVGNAPQSPPLT